MKPKRPKTLIFYRAIGKRKRQGDPSEALPGDLIIYFEDCRFSSREIQKVGNQFIITEPLVGPYGKLADSAKVKFEDIHEIIRLGEPEVEPTPPEEPLDEPVKPRKGLTGIRMPGRALRPGDPGYR